MAVGIRMWKGGKFKTEYHADAGKACCDSVSDFPTARLPQKQIMHQNPYATKAEQDNKATALFALIVLALVTAFALGSAFGQMHIHNNPHIPTTSTTSNTQNK